MANIFNFLISTPLYNGFILLIKNLPFFDAGVIIIIFTIVVKVIMLPLSLKASRSQLEMKSTEKDLALIKEQYKDNKEEHSRKTMEYYKEKGINPFSGFLVLLIQLPILIGLYRVFIKSGLPVINTALLYRFVMAPTSVNMLFLNLINISQKSLILAIVAGITTYFQVSLASGAQSQGTGTQGDVAKMMQVQMKYFFPILMTFIAYSISSAVVLYLITSNLFAIGQEIYIKKKYHKTTLVV
ncbi:membrane protein insertase YidC [Patescibacteria group bacterium]|nr:membrane protein insertase YidC [Patescibacteria group bacterium]